MADRTRAGGVNTAKARRKDGAARNKAHGLATRGRTKAGLGEEPDEADLTVPVPGPAGTTEAGARTYVITEHTRADTGALTVVLDLEAPDAPPEGYQPEGGLGFAIECVTHHSGPHRYATAAQARREAKASHKWCAGCKADLLQPKVHNRATAQTRSRVRGTG
jgi:hypothetical protein